MGWSTPWHGCLCCQYPLIYNGELPMSQDTTIFSIHCACILVIHKVKTMVSGGRAMVTKF